MLFHHYLVPTVIITDVTLHRDHAGSRQTSDIVFTSGSTRSKTACVVICAKLSNCVGINYTDDVADTCELLGVETEFLESSASSSVYYVVT